MYLDRYGLAMESILHIVGPAFCLIGLGYLAARLKYLSVSIGDALADFVFKVAVPVLLMKSIATAQFGQANPWLFVLVYFIAIAVAWISAVLVVRWVFKRGSRAAVIAGVAAGYSNLVLFGIPLVERAYGQPGLQILLFLLALHLPIMMTISTFLMEYAARIDGAEKDAMRPLVIAKNLGRNLLLNPIVIGIFIGIAWRLTGMGISGIPAQIMDLLARTTGPLALISLGMGLIKYGVRGNLIAAFSLAALSLVLMPAVVYLLATYIFPLPPLWLKVAMLGAACPTGVNAFLFANFFKHAEGLPFWLAIA
jgi:predicted permease